MPKNLTLCAGNNTDGVYGPFPEPIWKPLHSVNNGECWEVLLYSHQLLGALSAQIIWREKDHEGTITLYRNKEFLCPISPVTPRSYGNLEEFKDDAWTSILDFVTSGSVYLQNYIAWALKKNPSSESVKV